MYERLKQIIDKLEANDTRFASMQWVGKDYSKQNLLDDLKEIINRGEDRE